MSEEPLEPVRRKHRWLPWLLGVLVLVVVAGLAGPLPGAPRGFYKKSSWHQVCMIAGALADYREKHSGKLPSRLSELVPDDADAAVFFFSSKFTTTVRPPRAQAPSVVEGFTAYGFGPLEDGGFYVFERPGMWLDGTVACLVVHEGDPLLKGYRRYDDVPEPVHMTVKDFQKQVEDDFAFPLVPVAK